MNGTQGPMGHAPGNEALHGSKGVEAEQNMERGNVVSGDGSSDRQTVSCVSMPL